MTTTPNILVGRSRCNQWLGGLCALLILMASVGQTAHFCGVPVADSQSHVRVRALSTNKALCLTCLMAQSAAVAPLTTATAWALLLVPNLILPVDRIHSFRPSFHLYVRPPPAV